MSDKTYGRGDTVLVNFDGRMVHATVVGLDLQGRIKVNGSPTFGDLPCFIDDGKDHRGSVHACYLTIEKVEQRAAPAAETPFVPTSIGVENEGPK